MNKKNILFDLDGTLTDSGEGIIKSAQYALSFFGIDEKYENLLSFIGPPLYQSFINYGFDKQKAELAVEKYREYYKKTGIYENKLYDGVEDLLKSLTDNNKTIILATSKPQVFAEMVLKYFGIYKYFSFVSGGLLDGTRTEKDEVIEHVINTLKIHNQDENIMVGDRKYDILGAKKFNMESIGILNTSDYYEELKEAGADYIVNNISELNKLLLK